jgi:hypothetical protein
LAKRPFASRDSTRYASAIRFNRLVQDEMMSR